MVTLVSFKRNFRRVCLSGRMDNVCAYLSSETAAFLWKEWVKKTKVCVCVCMSKFLWSTVQANNLSEACHLKKGLPTSPITQHSLSTLSISSWCIDLSIGQTSTLEYIPETLAWFLRIRECDLEGLGSEQSKETFNALCDYNVQVQKNNSEGTE